MPRAGVESAGVGMLDDLPQGIFSDDAYERLDVVQAPTFMTCATILSGKRIAESGVVHQMYLAAKALRMLTEAVPVMVRRIVRVDVRS
ncbi:MAG: hypothetical protein ACREMP_02965 [Candidatus Tyrphobacter sp.]